MVVLWNLQNTLLFVLQYKYGGREEGSEEQGVIYSVKYPGNQAMTSPRLNQHICMWMKCFVLRALMTITIYTHVRVWQAEQGFIHAPEIYDVSCVFCFTVS